MSEDDWATCAICDHKINPAVGVCDEAWQHSPCTLGGCMPEQPE